MVSLGARQLRTRGPFGWPPPSAAPRCRHRQGSGRATKVAGQETVPADVEQTGLTITGAETQDKRLSVGNQGSLAALGHEVSGVALVKMVRFLSELRDANQETGVWPRETLSAAWGI